MSTETNQPYESVMIPSELFVFFLRKTFPEIPFTNDDCQEIQIDFAKYLHELNLTDEQKANTLPKSVAEVILNQNHPFTMNGFPPAYVWHFTAFIDDIKSKGAN